MLDCAHDRNRLKNLFAHVNLQLKRIERQLDDLDETERANRRQDYLECVRKRDQLLQSSEPVFSGHRLEPNQIRAIDERCTSLSESLSKLAATLEKAPRRHTSVGAPCCPLQAESEPKPRQP
jgi:hypothetical protein